MGGLSMPVVLKHKQTSQIYTCMLTNHYKLEYYGTKYWDDMTVAEAQCEEFLELMGDIAEDWQLIEIEDQQMKIYNVRLKNDPNFELFLDETNRPFVKKQEN
jgi:hypothetical protein